VWSTLVRSLAPRFLLHRSRIVSATGKVITSIAEGTPADVDTAVAAARKAFQDVWGLKTTGADRGHLMFKLAELMDKHAKTLAALESLDNGKTFAFSMADIAGATKTFRYYAGWADKNHGKVIEVRVKLFYLAQVISNERAR
jgi:aldehyde dehydrogenase (NAD+)